MEDWRGKPFFVVASHTLHCAWVCSLHLQYWRLPRHKPSGFVPEHRIPFTAFGYALCICNIGACRVTNPPGLLLRMVSPAPPSKKAILDFTGCLRIGLCAGGAVGEFHCRINKKASLAGDVLRNNLSNSEKRASEYRMLVCLCGLTNAMHWYSAYNCALLRRWEAGFVCSTNWNLTL